jgi:phosphatidylinositol alpha 1,6-mannosyltransferase
VLKQQHQMDYAVVEPAAAGLLRDVAHSSSGLNGGVSEIAVTISHRVIVRIAIISESFPPDVNGVAHCVLRVAEHLVRRGHQALVIAPQPARSLPRVPSAAVLTTEPVPCPVLRMPSLPMPGYPGFRLGLPSHRLRGVLLGHGTDLVHLASPFLLGASGAAAASRLSLPTVAVHQTDVPGYARVYGLGRLAEAIAWRRLRRIHNAADRTLAPSTASAAELDSRGIARVWLWGRGVDTERFHPAKRSIALRRELAPRGELLVGYVGRLAIEKRVDLLAGVAAVPGVRLVIVGAGPAAEAVRRALPAALFLGQRQGEELARIYASLDVFVHAGAHETFGQTLQEAAASGLPVVAPAAGGPLDLVQDGVTGYLVTPGSAAALAAAVTGLATDPGLRAAMGRAARKKLLGRSWSALGDELIGHYQAVLAARARPAAPADRTWAAGGVTT